MVKLATVLLNPCRFPTGPLIKRSQLKVDEPVEVVQVFGIDNFFVYFFGGSGSKWSPW